MQYGSTLSNELLSAICDEIDVPATYYERACERYLSIAKHLERRESELARWKPYISVQGSFRYGTLVKPIVADGEYDLDLVCELVGQSKSGTTQRALKESAGRELALYVAAHKMQSQLEEGRKVWHLHYADEIPFHIDVLASVPEDPATKRRIASALANVDPTGRWAELAIAITDNRSSDFATLSSKWPSSNPRGLGLWFSSRMSAVAEPRRRYLVEAGRYRTIDDVPEYEWKTPLQRSIQVLKRHRDVMFKDNCDHKPISMIVTCLAAHAYQGEPSLEAALPAIVERMSGLVSATRPRVPNPVNPSEDFADKWANDSRLEASFDNWMDQLRRDLARLESGLGAEQMRAHLESRFGVRLPDDRVVRFAAASSVAAAPHIQIKERPRPWGLGS